MGNNPLMRLIKTFKSEIGVILPRLNANVVYQKIVNWNDSTWGDGSPLTVKRIEIWLAWHMISYNEKREKAAVLTIQRSRELVRQFMEKNKELLADFVLSQQEG
jgi:hypothetical protein